MKRGFLRKICLAGAGLLMIAAQGCAKKTSGQVERIQAEGRLRVAIVDTGSWYTSMDGDTPVGLEPELARYIADALGVPVSYQVCSRDEALGAVSAGEADVAMGCINNSGTLSGEYQVSTSYGKGYFYAVTQTGDYALTIGAFENSSVGVAKDLDEATRASLYQVDGIRLEDYNSAAEGGRAVKDGKIRAYICYENQAGELLEDEELQVQNMVNLDPEEFVVVAAGEDPALISGINILIQQFLEKE